VTRVIVVGAGVIGLLTALECAAAGAQVTVVEQGDIPCPWSSSYDRHRVVRALHAGDPAVSRAAAVALRGWIALERVLGVRMFHRVGALTVLSPSEVAPGLAVLAAADVAAQPLTAADLAGRYPHIAFAAGRCGVLEPGAGAVLADRALDALAGHLRAKPGVQLMPRRRVSTVDRSGTVRLADGAVLAGDATIVAAGPWSRSLVPVAGLTLYRQSVLSCAPWWSPHDAGWAPTPVIPALGTPGGAWLVPPVAGTPLRLSAHSACRVVTEVTGEQTPAQWRDWLIDTFRPLLEGFSAAAVTGARDGYYVAEAGTGAPKLVQLGPSAWAYAACGGQSFKFAPLIARSLARRATGGAPVPTGLAAIDQIVVATTSST
jgi:sarcosine oxidase